MNPNDSLDCESGRHSLPQVPLVSIGLPTFNGAKSLARAINSALNQDYQNIELVISDNASSDDTEAVCRDAANRDKRIKYLCQETNVGPIANFRDVLSRSTGQFFMWLADDDWLDSSYVGRCAEFLSEHADYSLVCGKAKYFRDGKPESDGTFSNILHENGRARILDYYAKVWDNGELYGMMRRAQISDLKLKNTMGGDWLFTAAVAFRGKVGMLKDVCINRALGGSTSSYEKVAATLGLSRFSASYPRISIATAALKDILTSPAYSQLSVLGRASLGCKVFALIERRNEFYIKLTPREIVATKIERVLPENVVQKIHKRRSQRHASLHE